MRTAWKAYSVTVGFISPLTLTVLFSLSLPNKKFKSLRTFLTVSLILPVYELNMTEVSSNSALSQMVSHSAISNESLVKGSGNVTPLTSTKSSSSSYSIIGVKTNSNMVLSGK